MKPGDSSPPAPPIIPARLREVSSLTELGSVTRGNVKLSLAVGTSNASLSSDFAAGRRPALRWWGLGIFFLAMAACWVLYQFNPSQYSFYPRCVFNLATGLLCPGCGSQRALHQLIHGHLLTACRCNLLLMLALPWLAFQAARQALAEWHGTPGPQWLPHPRCYKWLVAAAVLFAVLRNIPGAPFCYLAPP